MMTKIVRCENCGELSEVNLNDIPWWFRWLVDIPGSITHLKKCVRCKDTKVDAKQD